MSKVNSSKTVKTVDNAKNANSKNLLKSNLSALQEKIGEIEKEEKKRGMKETIYIYPENWNSDIINGKQGKQFRNGKRKALDNFSYDIRLSLKKGDMDILKKHIELFDTFYKTFYKRNDYSLESVSQRNEDKNGNIIMMLDIIKTFKAS